MNAGDFPPSIRTRTLWGPSLTSQRRQESLCASNIREKTMRWKRDEECETVRGESDWTHTQQSVIDCFHCAIIAIKDCKLACGSFSHVSRYIKTSHISHTHKLKHKHTILCTLNMHNTSNSCLNIHSKADFHKASAGPLQMRRVSQDPQMLMWNSVSSTSTQRPFTCMCVTASHQTQGSQRVYSVHTQTSGEHTRHWGAISHDKNPDEELSFLLSDEELGHATLYCHHHHSSRERDGERERQSLQCQWCYLNQRQASKERERERDM